jgi:hypothetical protein
VCYDTCPSYGSGKAGHYGACFIFANATMNSHGSLIRRRFARKPVRCFLVSFLSILPQTAHAVSTCAGGLCCTAWQVAQFRAGKHWADIKEPTYESLERVVENSKNTDRRLCNYFHGTDCSVTYSNPTCATPAPHKAISGSAPSCPGYRGIIPPAARACRTGETPAIVDFYGKNLSCAWCY